MIETTFAEFCAMGSKKYGAGWRAIRKAALRRADKKCEVGDGTPWGLCTQSERARLHVHHVGVYAYTTLWPILSFEDVYELIGYAYFLARKRRQKELENYLLRNPELFPVVCPHHHTLFEWHRVSLLRLVAMRGERNDTQFIHKIR